MAVGTSDAQVVVPADMQVLGDSDVNGDSNVDGAVSCSSIEISTVLALTPTASPPAGETEGMLYADTDHKLYYYNGTDWKEVAFV